MSGLRTNAPKVKNEPLYGCADFYGMDIVNRMKAKLNFLKLKASDTNGKATRK